MQAQCTTNQSTSGLAKQSTNKKTRSVSGRPSKPSVAGQPANQTNQTVIPLPSGSSSLAAGQGHLGGQATMQINTSPQHALQPRWRPPADTFAERLSKLERFVK